MRRIIFQFLYGAIKSGLEAWRMRSSMHFNSSMVRLKAVINLHKKALNFE